MINEKEDVGVFLLSEEGDDAVKLQLIRGKLKDNTGFTSALGTWYHSYPLGSRLNTGNAEILSITEYNGMVRHSVKIMSMLPRARG
jgi:hypothetical protein